MCLYKAHSFVNFQKHVHIFYKIPTYFLQNTCIRIFYKIRKFLKKNTYRISIRIFQKYVFNSLEISPLRDTPESPGAPAPLAVRTFN